MKPPYVSLLVCPLCLGPLHHAQAPADARYNEELWCYADGLAFPMVNDMPLMLENKARTLSTEEKKRRQPRRSTLASHHLYD